MFLKHAQRTCDLGTRLREAVFLVPAPLGSVLGTVGSSVTSFSSKALLPGLAQFPKNPRVGESGCGISRKTVG